MSSRPDHSVGMLGGVAVGLGLCCGLPILLASGVAIGVSGAVLGSALLAAIGIGVTVWPGNDAAARPTFTGSEHVGTAQP